jgi:hypothetical protein
LDSQPAYPNSIVQAVANCGDVETVIAAQRGPGKAREGLIEPSARFLEIEQGWAFDVPSEARNAEEEAASGQDDVEVAPFHLLDTTLAVPIQSFQRGGN